MKNLGNKKFSLILGTALLLFIFITGSCNKPDDTPSDPVSVTDVDGNVYPVIRIGNQLWTTENLKTTKYNDGTAIATGLDNAAWNAATAGAYSIYNNVQSNNNTYGKLYNWYAVNTGKLAPAGWHIPTRAEYETLLNFLGTDNGGKMKATAALWNAPNTGATNTSGFTGLPGGYRANSGNYALAGDAGYWWAATEANSTQGRYMELNSTFSTAVTNGATKQFGMSVRCIKD